MVSTSSSSAATAALLHRGRRAAYRTLLLPVLLLAAVAVVVAVAAGSSTVKMLPLRQHKATLGADGARPVLKRLVVNPTATSTTGAPQTESQPTHITMLAGCASSGFSTPVTIGSQTFNVLVDSGSATVAVAGPSCTSNACSGNQALSPTYTAGASAQDMNTEVSVTYGSGSWSGHAYTDDVNVAGVGSVRMAMAAIDTASDFFRTSKCAATYNQGNQYQGILGLAYGSLAPSGSDAYWDTLMDSSNDVANVFAHQMCGSAGNGRLWIGGYDSTFFTGSLSYTAITDESWYVVGMQGMTFGGAAVPGVDASSYGTTIVDSGTTALVLPSGVYSALTNQIVGNSYFAHNFGSDFFSSSGYCVVPANGATADQLNANLPQLAITLAGGVVLTLNAVPSYLVDQTDGSGTHYYCPGVSTADGSASVQTILGYAALNQHTVVYDRANSRIGFAPTAQCGTTAPTVTGYAWYASGWGTCSSTDGTAAGCTQTRTVTCKDSNGNTVADAQCSGSTKPSVSETGCQSWASDAGVCQGPDAPSPSSAAESWWNDHPTARAIIIAVIVIAGVCLALAILKCFCKTICCCRKEHEGMAEPLTPRGAARSGRREPYAAHPGLYAATVVPGGAPGGPMPVRHCQMCNTPANVPGNREWSCSACTFVNKPMAGQQQQGEVAVVVVH